MTQRLTDASVPRTGAGRAFLRHPVPRLFVSMGVVQGSLFVSGTLLVRALGVEERGELALVSAMVAIGAQLGLFGFPAAFVFFISSRNLEGRRLLRVVARGFLAQLVLVAVLASAGLVVISMLGQPMTQPVVETAFVAAGVAVFMVAALSLAAVQGEQRFTAFTVLQAAPILAYASMVALLFVTGTGTIATYLLASNLGWLVVPVATYYVLRRTRRRPTGPLPTLREVRSFGGRSSVAAASPTDLLGVDQLLIGVLLGHAPLGLYVVGWAFETATVLPGAVLGGFVGPHLAGAAPHDRPRIAWRWVLVTVAGSALICLVLQLILPWLVVFAFGEAARGAVVPARILVAAGVFLGLRRLLGVVLQSMDRPQWSTWAELASLSTMVGGVAVLGVLFGINGACLAMGLAGLVGSVVQLAMLARAGRELSASPRRGTAPSPAGPSRP